MKMIKYWVFENLLRSLLMTFLMVCLILATCFQKSFWFYDSILSLACCSVFKLSDASLYSCLCFSEEVGSFSTSFKFLLSFFILLSISTNFEVLFTSSPCIDCKASLIPRKFCKTKSVFCDVSCVLIWTFSTKDESSVSGTLSISVFVDNSRLSLIAALKDSSNTGRILSMHKYFSFHRVRRIYLLMFLVKKFCLFVLSKEPPYHHCKTLK